MRSLRRICLERRMWKNGVLSVAEFANLMRVWAKRPELLWDDPAEVEQKYRYTLSSDDDGKFVYERTSSEHGSGVLYLPSGSSMLVIVEYDPRGSITAIRLVIDAHTPSDPRQLHIAAIWITGRGLTFSVNERSGNRHRRMRRVMRRRYGWTVKAATVPELVRMYFSHALPRLVLRRSRNCVIDEA